MIEFVNYPMGMCLIALIVALASDKFLEQQTANTLVLRSVFYDAYLAIAFVTIVVSGILSIKGSWWLLLTIPTIGVIVIALLTALIVHFLRLIFTDVALRFISIIAGMILTIVLIIMWFL